jgi:glutathione S-transferase
MKLYYAPKTRSLRPRWLLEEAGAPYELVRLDRGKAEHRTEEYKKIHPLNRVPALVDGELTMFESAAICMYLADKLDGGRLAPPLNTPERGRYYQWMAFATATLEPAVDAASKPGAGDDTRAELHTAVAAVEQALDGRDWLLSTFSAADVMIGQLLLWAGAFKLLGEHPKAVAYIDRCKQRPAFQRARAD